ncbi:hypothetical protein LJC48_00585 [Desulfovibrio sp. OttesenSCG-928-C06]|nr:hypothetical protein [Desulfovibrio sp. OttesenSCG-928-C06]
MARQIASIGFICSAIFTVLACIAMYRSFTGTGGEAALNANNLLLANLPLVSGLIAASMVLQVLHLILWKVLRKTAFVQLLLLLAVIAANFSVMVLFLQNYRPDSMSAIMAGTWFAKALQGLVFPLLLQGSGSFAASAALAGSLSVCWLLLRRNADDFGRDYYNFAVSRCSGITMIFAVISLLLIGTDTGIAIYQLELFSFNILAFPLAVLALQIVSCIVWFLAFRSKAPLRQKAGLWICLPLWALSCGLQVF